MKGMWMWDPTRRHTVAHTHAANSDAHQCVDDNQAMLPSCLICVRSARRAHGAGTLAEMAFQGARCDEPLTVRTHFLGAEEPLCSTKTSGI